MEKYILKDNRILIALSVLSAVGTLMFNALPVMFQSISAVIPFDEEQQGILSGIAGLSTLIVSITANLWVPRSNWKKVTGFSFIPICVGILMLWLVSDFNMLCAALFIFNIGAAILFVMSITIISRAPDPSRSFGIKTVFEIVLAGTAAY